MQEGTRITHSALLSVRGSLCILRQFCSTGVQTVERRTGALGLRVWKLIYRLVGEAMSLQPVIGVLPELVPVRSQMEKSPTLHPCAGPSSSFYATREVTE